jgi:N-formylglutamate deformylase
MDFHFKAGTRSRCWCRCRTSAPTSPTKSRQPGALRAARADTDWHLAELYAFAAEMGASMLAARWSRYLIDLNRPPENTNLYPGQDTTGLCPVDTFGRERLYREGMEPRPGRSGGACSATGSPTTAAARELDRLLALHGRVVLWDAHSIASTVPRFFEGRLPDLNFGTADGTSCSMQLEGAMIQAAEGQDRYSFVFNGRFKGGHITRHYGNPAGGVHAIQLEMCQCLYMDEAAPFGYRPDLAGRGAAGAAQLLGTALEWVRQ